MGERLKGWLGIGRKPSAGVHFQLQELPKVGNIFEHLVQITGSALQSILPSLQVNGAQDEVIVPDQFRVVPFEEAAKLPFTLVLIRPEGIVTSLLPLRKKDGP